MTLSERIVAARAALVATKDAIAALDAKDELDASDMLQMAEHATTLDRQTAELETMLHAEKSLAASAKPAGSENAAQTQQQGATRRSAFARKRDPMDVLVREALITLEAHVTNDSPESIIARRYPGIDDVVQVHRYMTMGPVLKAATNPAMTNVAGWAAELVRDGYGAFMDALESVSVLPQLPLQRFEFDGFNKITIPARADTFPTEPNLAAAFRAEGAPIRVGRTTLTSKFLAPKSMGVISTFTLELLRRSTPSIEAVIRDCMLADTAKMLDAAFLSAFAGNALRPAGMQAGLAAGDTAASGGNTGAAILEDMKGRLQSMAGQGLGARAVWVMNTKHAFGVKLATTPTGERMFPDASGGSVGGIPLVSSTNVPIGTVFLIDAAQVAFAGGAPQFSGSTEATIHEESGDPNTDEITGPTVLPIATGAPGAAVVATPVRSFWQTNTAGIRALWELDWLRLRAGAVQTITGVGW